MEGEIGVLGRGIIHLEGRLVGPAGFVDPEGANLCHAMEGVLNHSRAHEVVVHVAGDFRGKGRENGLLGGPPASAGVGVFLGQRLDAPAGVDGLSRGLQVGLPSRNGVCVLAEVVFFGSARTHPCSVGVGCGRGGDSPGRGCLC